MSLAPRERLAPLRAGAAALAATNVVLGLGALVLDLPTAAGDVATATKGPTAPAGTSSPDTVLAASVHPLLRTTTTLVPTDPGSAAGTPARARATGPRRVVSTGYCLEGLTASGVPVGPGMVAMNGVPLGSAWLVHDGPFAGATLEATDRIGHSTEFDIWFDDCDEAMDYGRRTITVEQVG